MEKTVGKSNSGQSQLREVRKHVSNQEKTHCGSCFKEIYSSVF